jgi:hypothetical protein
MVCYTIGMPIGFAVVLFRYRTQIQADQGLRAVGVGNTLATNPFFQVPPSPPPPHARSCALPPWRAPTVDRVCALTCAP